jgi:pyridoxal/pyridoxine/pyridoxamine kinase
MDVTKNISIADDSMMKLSRECNVDIHTILCIYASLATLNETELSSMAKENELENENDVFDLIKQICSKKNKVNTQDSRDYMMSTLKKYYPLKSHHNILESMTKIDLFRVFSYINNN